MAKPKNLKKQLEKQIPSRAQLGMESMFGETAEIRASAQHLLDILPKKERSRDEEVQWMTEIWTMPVPSREDMLQSPIGRMTLQMLDENSKQGDWVGITDPISAPEAPTTEAEVVTNAAMPAVEDDGVNDILKRLDWPPRPTPQPKAEQDEQPHKWQAARPTPESRGDLQFLPPDSDYSSNQPLY